MLQELLAQAGTALPDLNWAQVVSSIGFAGLTVFLITRYLPAVHKDFREEIKSCRDAHKDDLRDVRSAHQQEMKAEHDAQLVERSAMLTLLRDMELQYAEERKLYIEEAAKFRDALREVARGKIQ